MVFADPFKYERGAVHASPADIGFNDFLVGSRRLVNTEHHHGRTCDAAELVISGFLRCRPDQAFVRAD